MLNQKLKTIEPMLQNWWEHGEQEKPLIIASITENKSALVEPDLKKYWEDTEGTVKRAVECINHTKYYGVSVPYHYIDFGSSAMAGVLGANMEYVDKETIWAHPKCNTLEELENIAIDKSNLFFKRIIDLTEKSVSVANNHHFIAHYALGGIGDTISGLYGTENMLMDMYDEPDLLKKVMRRIMAIWAEQFESVSKIIKKSGNSGGIGWAGVWAPGMTFPIQEDMAYMLSPDMFKEFCLEHIVNMTELMDYPFFHLDGIGMIPHLDYILDISKLKVIQWQPGAGKEGLKQWYPLIERILKAGKSVQLYARAEEVDDAVKHLGSRGLLFIITNANNENARAIMK